MTEDTNVTPQADTEEDTAKQLLHMCKSHDSLLSSDIPHVHFNKEVAVTNGEVLVEALDALTGAPVRIRYTNVKTFARGAFGMVFVASLDNGRQVAIKKLLRDKRYKNRELLILRQLRHPNIVALLYFFYTLPNSEGKEATQAFQSPCDCCKHDRSSTSFTEPKETYLNLVQEYVPETLSRIIKHYNSLRQLIPIALIKIYSFQILRALAYIHSQKMCHRDIKPQNILVNPETGILKICDFGSTKVLVPGEPNVSYICSRYYRAPELIFGATHYTVSIDIWSAGCVIGELLLGRPLFPGDSGIDQLVEIIKVLGTPTLDDVKSMNPHYSKFAFPLIKGCPWEKLIHRRSNDIAFDLLRDLLVYCPSNRQSAAKCLPSPFFSDVIFASPEEASSSVYCLVNGRPLPPLIDNFSDEELTYLPVDFAAKIRSAISILRSEPSGPSSSNNSSLLTGNAAMMDRTHSLPGFNLLNISSCSILNDYSGTVPICRKNDSSSA